VVLWINGTFGVGKTTAANLIREQDPAWRLFDPEWVGYMLRANLGDVPCDDFQDLPPWRTLVPRVAHEIALLTGDNLLAMQTVLVEEYWGELRRGFTDHRMEVFHVVLDADEATVRSRIMADGADRGAAQWRLDHLHTYNSARAWMTASADLVVDTAGLTAAETASLVVDALR
jgi:hypothetical protein